MDSLHVRNLMEAYVSVYDEDLRQELSYIDEDLSFVDDLSDNELVQIMEEILSEEEVTLQECLDIFEGELISEAESPARARKRQAREAERKEKFQKATRPVRARGRLAKQRLSQASSQAAENIKTKSAGAASAVAGGAAEVGRKLSSAKEKIKGFLKGAKKAATKVVDRISGKEAKRTAIKRTAFNKRKEERAAASKSMAKRSFDKPSSEAPKSTWRAGGENVKRTFQSSASSSSSGTSSTGGKKSTLKPNVPGRKERVSSGGIESKTVSANSGGPSSTGRALSPAKARLALPPEGGTTKPKPNVGRTRIGNQTKPVPTRPGVRIAGGSGFGRGVSTPQTTKKGMKTAAGAITKINASYEMLTDMIAEELMFEGYASNLWEAYDIILEMDDFDLDDIVEAFEEYLVEEVEGEDYVDAYDVVLQHLLDEGYADSVESAESIMANMSEEWRISILG
jgi:hypothetical protein